MFVGIYTHIYVLSLYCQLVCVACARALKYILLTRLMNMCVRITAQCTCVCVWVFDVYIPIP